MNKISFEINRETNYVYHMLSVARCGYDNAYGERYRQLHDAADLAVLKRYEEHLTVRGGAHHGRLYWPLIALCARGKVPAEEYYKNFYPSWNLADLAEACEEICDVMARNYPVYCTCVWPETEAEIQAWLPPLAERFEASGFAETAERMIGTKLEIFRPMMVNSVEFGAEAIDISPDQDVFGITRTYEDAFWFIAHEYIIYLLKAALCETAAFQSIETWSITEGLAEFYLKRITGTQHFFDFQRDIVLWFEKLYEKMPDLSPAEGFCMAEKQFLGRGGG